MAYQDIHSVKLALIRLVASIISFSEKDKPYPSSNPLPSAHVEDYWVCTNHDHHSVMKLIYRIVLFHGVFLHKIVLG